ncbi:phage tail tape measure protein [Schinkia azotoformans]|uniref:phage tail tape measure protein n=1 Tax=Schinkia azotoformans TaxID=1454 RepID=UPI002DBA576D|nr:phage tail tape measure protein [Schinkia azotoformans]MEC1744115.1 phage tail tape measure protein [Schinkia azotoformans]
MPNPLTLAFVIAGKLNSSFSSTFKKANDKVNDTNKSLIDIQKELRNYEKLQKQGVKEVDKSAKAHEMLEVKYNQSLATLQQLSQSMDAYKNAIKVVTEQKKRGEISTTEYMKAQKELWNSFNQNKSAFQLVEKEMKSVKEEMDQLADAHQQGKLKVEANAKAYAELARELEKAEQKQKRLTELTERQQKLSDLQGKVQGFSQGSMATGLQTAAAMTVPVYASIKFESSMADVKKVVDFETTKELKEMEKGFINLSKRIPMTANALAQIGAAGGQSGVAKSELLKFTEDAAKMGTAFDIAADEAGQTMAEWRTSFKMNQVQVVELADKINHLGNTTAAAAPKISEVVKRVGPLGEVGGVVSGEIAALGASMVGVGVAEEVAATGIKNMILALTKGESATKGQKEAFKAIGLDAVEMSKLMQTDAQKGIMSVFKAIQGLEKHKQAAVLDEIFGSESIGAIAPLLTNLEMVEENFNKVGNATKYAESMQKEFDARSNTTENKLILLKNHAAALGITVGNTVLPQLNSAAVWLVNVTNKVQAFSEKHPTLTRNLLLGAAAFTGLALSAGIVGFTISNVIIPIGLAVTWMKKVELASKGAALGTKIWAGSQKVLNLVMKMNPIMRVVSLIGLLITVAVALYKNFEPVQKIVDGLWASFKKTFPDAAKWIQGVYDKTTKLVGKFKEWLKLGGGKEKSLPSTSTGGLKQIERYAKGGILTRPHIGMVAEEGPEAVIPLNGSQRAYSLWLRAGQLLGVQARNGKQPRVGSNLSGLRQAKDNLKSVSSTSVVYNINYAPSLSGGQNVNEVKQVLKQDKGTLLDQLKQLDHDRERLKFA